MKAKTDDENPLFVGSFARFQIEDFLAINVLKVIIFAQTCSASQLFYGVFAHSQIEDHFESANPE